MSRVNWFPKQRHSGVKGGIVTQPSFTLENSQYSVTTTAGLALMCITASKGEGGAHFPTMNTLH